MRKAEFSRHILPFVTVATQIWVNREIPSDSVHRKTTQFKTCYIEKLWSVHTWKWSLCWVNKITWFTCNGLGFWSTGMMRITISDSILKYPNTSHCGTETCRRIFSSMSSTVIGFLFVTWNKTNYFMHDVTVWKMTFLLFSFYNLMSCQKICFSH